MVICDPFQWLSDLQLGDEVRSRLESSGCHYTPENGQARESDQATEGAGLFFAVFFRWMLVSWCGKKMWVRDFKVSWYYDLFPKWCLFFLSKKSRLMYQSTNQHWKQRRLSCCKRLSLGGTITISISSDGWRRSKQRFSGQRARDAREGHRMPSVTNRKWTKATCIIAHRIHVW